MVVLVHLHKEFHKGCNTRCVTQVQHRQGSVNLHKTGCGWNA